MALSESWLKGQLGKPLPKPEVKTDRDGLGIRISVNGKLTWQFRYSWAGKQTKVTLGTFPATSLKAARDKALLMRTHLENNQNPADVLLADKQQAEQAMTVEQLLREWHRIYCVKNKKTHQEIIRVMENHLFPVLGKRAHDRVSAADWFTLLENLASEKPGPARKLLINVKQAHAWAARRQLTTHKPLTEVRLPDVGVTNNVRKRTLSDGEIVTLFGALEKSRLNDKYKLFVKLCLLFACRTGELGYARQDHFDFAAMIWTIPPEFHKTGEETGRPITRPIIPAAKTMLQELFELSNDATYAITKERSKQPLGNATLTKIPTLLNKTALRYLNVQLDHWTLHDLRRTARTNFSTLTTPEVAETMLGHTLPGLFPVYDQNDYLPEQELAYRKWWTKVEGLVYGEGVVTPMFGTR